ncbi:MAG: RND family transporter, partial [Rickettsiales bacterium TMED254]
MIDLFYNKFIFKFSKLVLLFLTSLTFIMLYFAADLKIDASSDSLILEKDKDLKYYQLISQRYKSPDFLIIAYTPNDFLLSSKVKNNIKNIAAELQSLEAVKSVTTILNVPLLESSKKSLADILEGVPTIEDNLIEESEVIKELTNSSLYKNNLVSENFKTTAILINLKDNNSLLKLKQKKSDYQNQMEGAFLNKNSSLEYKKILKLIDIERNKQRSNQSNLILDIRKIINDYKNTGDIYLGGIPMISNDVVAFVKNDLKVFGLSILVFLIMTLSIIFRQSRWVIMPIMTCFCSVIITAGIFSILNWEVT